MYSFLIPPSLRPVDAEVAPYDTSQEDPSPTAQMFSMPESARLSPLTYNSDSKIKTFTNAPRASCVDASSIEGSRDDSRTATIETPP